MDTKHELRRAVGRGLGWAAGGEVGALLMPLAVLALACGAAQESPCRAIAAADSATPSVEVPARAESHVVGSCAPESSELPDDGFGLLGARGTLQALCDRAAQNPCAFELGPNVFCEEEGTRRSIVVDFEGGSQRYLTHREGDEIVVVHALEMVEYGATEAGGSEITSIATWTSAGRALSAITTKAYFVDYEDSDAGGWTREQVTFCEGEPARASCGRTIPLAFELWSGSSPDGGFAPEEGFVVTERESATATAVPENGDTIRYTLVSGTWRLLYGGDFFDPDSAILPSAPEVALPMWESR